jgi:quinol monooxygenase YgiN
MAADSAARPGAEVLITRLCVRPERVEEARGFFREMAEDVRRSEPGTLAYAFYQERADPTTFWVHEVFAGAEALERHLARHEWRRARFDALLARAAEFNACRPLGSA